MKSILKEIIQAKKIEVANSKKKLSLNQLRAEVLKLQRDIRDFRQVLISKKKVSIIGELKIASPSKGILHKDLDLEKTALLYEKNGVSAISVLTDKHFKGKLSDLKKVRKQVNLPVLRKDFIVDIYQVYESYIAGADAVLLIAAILTKEKLAILLEAVHCLGMNAIIEVHDPDEIEKIDFKKARIIGINNRNLDTFEVDLNTTKLLLKKIPGSMVVVSESGIFSRKDILFLGRNKVNAVLIGEGIVTSSDIGRQIKKLIGEQ